MRTSPKVALAGVALLVLVFIAGVWQLLQLKFDTGTVYQPYSTFRPDPLGAKALFDSVVLLPGLEVSRNIEDFDALPKQAMTIMLLGVRPPAHVPRYVLERAAEGARVVYAFVPVQPEREARLVGREYLWADLGVHLMRPVGPIDDSVTGPPRESSLHFRTIAPEWKTYRQVNGKPVVIERPWKKGTVVLVADSYALSNEGVMSAPDAAEIAWLLGPHKKVVFDETHLGVHETGSVAGLMRRYRLEGLVASVIALALLFVWSRAVSFLPEPTALRTHEIAGRASSEGLLALLERSVPPAKLIEVCVEHWANSPAGRSSKLKPDVAAAATAISASPAEAYERIRRKLEESSHPWKQ